MRGFATVLVVGVATAHADPAPDAQPTPGQALFVEGRALLEANHPAEACEKFEASLRLEPDAAGPMLNLGLCNEQLDRLATALRWFRRVETRAAELNLPEVESAAKDKATALASRVPTLRIVFTQPAPDGTAVALDGSKLEDIDYQRVELDAGHHELALSGPGLVDERRTAELADGDAKTVTFSPHAPPPPKKEWITVDRGRSRRLLAYIVGGVGAGLLVGDTVFVLVAKHEYDATERPDIRQSWQSAVRYGGTSAFVVGAAAIAASTWWYLHAPGPEHVERTVVAPVIDRERIGVALSGAF